MMNYQDFLVSKMDITSETGFKVDRLKLNPALKPHQLDAVEWALKGGRRAIFALFGLGKTVMALEFCRQVIEHCRENGNQDAKALIILPLGVKQEFIRDARDILKWGQLPQYVRTMEEIRNASSPIMLTNIVLTEVVRENNQTYRLGWSEQCKDGTKMGVGCPEYVLLFRKLPSDTSKAYADMPVEKSKEAYTRAQWQIDANAFWRSSGDKLPSREELESCGVDKLQKLYNQYSRSAVYDYDDHVQLGIEHDSDGKHLPATFASIAPSSWSEWIWDNILRFKTLNLNQARRNQISHVCPLQLDLIERLINRYTNVGETVFDPFGGIMSVPYQAVKMNRYGIGCELSADYWCEGIAYVLEAEQARSAPTLFDLILRKE